MSKQNDDIRVQLAALFEEHDYNKRYERLSVVYYMVDGKIEFYQAVKDVPRFTPISDTRVWNKSSNAILTSSEEPTFDNDFIPIYCPPGIDEQVPSYYLETVDDNVFVIIITAEYIIPNQTTQPEITGIKINNVSYTLVSSKDVEPTPGLASTEEHSVMPVDEELYEEIQYMKQEGVDIDANIGDGLFVVVIAAIADTALSGPITFELNTDVGNCTIIVPEYVEPKQSYIYVTRDDTYDIGFSDGYYQYDYDDTQAWASYLKSDIGNTTTITVSGNYVACTGWQESSDGETWTDIPNSASNELEVTVPEESHYYKPIVISAEPNWVEISRTVNNTTCKTDADGFNTGICNVEYEVTYEDQNPNSTSYNNTHTGYVTIEEEDLVSCPIPQTSDTPIYINAFTEHTVNGTPVINDSFAAYITDGHYYRWNSDGSQSGNYALPIPYTGSIKLKTGDNIGIDFKIHIVQGYTLDGLYYRESDNGSWTSAQKGLTEEGWVSFDTSSTYFELKVIVRQEQQSGGTPSSEPNYLYIQAKQANVAIDFSSTLQTPPDIQYSYDKNTWTQLVFTAASYGYEASTIMLNSIGDKVYFKGTNAFLCDDNSQETHFWITGEVKIGGNVQTLVDSTGTSTTAICMRDLFSSNPDITEVEADLLPATTLCPYCYENIFSYTSITSPVSLPATIMEPGCYVGMFFGTSFNTSSDGTNFNFTVNLTLPQRVSSINFNTYKDVATWMGNANGFN